MCLDSSSKCGQIIQAPLFKCSRGPIVSAGADMTRGFHTLKFRQCSQTDVGHGPLIMERPEMYLNYSATPIPYEKILH